MPVRAVQDAMKRAVQPTYVSVTEAELMTGVSKWTWRVYAYKGLITSVKLGGPKGRLLIPISEVNRLLAEGTRPRIVPQENPRRKVASAR
jgi:hypothetical protein